MKVAQYGSSARGRLEGDLGGAERDGGQQGETRAGAQPAPRARRARLPSGEGDADDRHADANELNRARSLAAGEADRERDQRGRRGDRRDDAHRADREPLVQRADADRAAEACEHRPEDRQAVRRRLPADEDDCPEQDEPGGLRDREDGQHRHRPRLQAAEEVATLPTTRSRRAPAVRRPRGPEVRCRRRAAWRRPRRAGSRGRARPPRPSSPRGRRGGRRRRGAARPGRPGRAPPARSSISRSAEVDVAEQPALGRLPERRAAARARRCGRRRAGARPRAAGRRAAAGGAGRARGRWSPRRPCARAGRPRSRGGRPGPPAARGGRRELGASPRSGATVARSPWMGDLGGEELEEAVELVRVAPHRGREPRRVVVGRGLDRAHLELEPVAEALDAAEHANRVAFAEARVEQVDVVPDASLDAAARVDELEREVRRPALVRSRRLRATA